MCEIFWGQRIPTISSSEEREYTDKKKGIQHTSVARLNRDDASQQEETICRIKRQHKHTHIARQNRRTAIGETRLSFILCACVCQCLSDRAARREHHTHAKLSAVDELDDAAVRRNKARGQENYICILRQAPKLCVCVCVYTHVSAAAAAAAYM